MGADISKHRRHKTVRNSFKQKPRNKRYHFDRRCNNIETDLKEPEFANLSWIYLVPGYLQWPFRVTVVETGITRRATYSSVTLSTTNPTWTGLWSDTRLEGKNSETNRVELGHNLTKGN